MRFFCNWLQYILPCFPPNHESRVSVILSKLNPTRVLFYNVENNELIFIYLTTFQSKSILLLFVLYTSVTNNLYITIYTQPLWIDYVILFFNLKNNPSPYATQGYELLDVICYSKPHKIHYLENFAPFEIYHFTYGIMTIWHNLLIHVFPRSQEPNWPM